MNIPTLSDYLVYVEGRMAAAAVMDDELAESLCHVFTSTTSTEVDLFNCIAYSQGCHSLAEALRKRGDDATAGLYYAMGQDLLSKAAGPLAEMMAASVDRLGIKRN